MSEHPGSAPAPEHPGEASTYPADLTVALQAELAALADVEAAYATKRRSLETWEGPQKLKERIIREVELRHRLDREPHVLRLSEVYGRMMNLTMFRGLRTRH